MWWLDFIISYLRDVRDWFQSAYLEVNSWIYPLYLLATPLYWLYYSFFYIHYYFGFFNEWVADVQLKISQILSLDNIKSYLQEWLDKALEAWNWTQNAWLNIKGDVADWWTSTMGEVQGWIAIATEGLDTLKVAWGSFWTVTFPQWTSKLDQLAGDWNHFFTHTLPTLFDISFAEEWWRGKITDITGLIAAAFTERESWWAGWQDWRDQVTEFFADPEQWFYNRLDSFFERFW